MLTLVAQVRRKNGAVLRRILLDAPTAEKLAKFYRTRTKALLTRTPIPFSTGYRLEPDERFVATVELPELGKQIVGGTIPSEVAKLKRTTDLTEVVGLLAFDHKKKQVAYQKITAHQRLASGFSILFENTTRLTDGISGISFPNRIHAVHSNRQLSFISERFARSFLGFKSILMSISDADVDALLRNFRSYDKLVHFKLADDICRRMIGEIIVSGGLPAPTAKMKRDARAFGIALAVQDGSIVMPETRRELKDLLRFLTDRYLNSILVEGVRYYTNSRRRI